MNVIVIYDSYFGNTQKIAETVARQLNGKAVRVDEVSLDTIKEADVVIVGSPIRGWRPSEKTQALLSSWQAQNFTGKKKAAAFDTRVKKWYSGDAAKKIENQLRKIGFEIITPAKPFIVLGKEGPLADDQIEAATQWGQLLNEKIRS